MYLYSAARFRITLVIFMNFCFSHSSGSYIAILPTFVKHFRAPHPLPLHYKASRNEKVNITRECSHQDLRLWWIDKQGNEELFLLVLSAKKNLPSIGKIDINQQIYFLTPDFNLYEKYMVNSYVVVEMLGQFVNNTYFPRKDIEDNFMKRRNDFHGLELVGLTEESQYSHLTNLTKAKYFPSNDTYDVTNHIHGSYYEILQDLETRLNFTTKLYKRKIKGWGAPILYSNGSIKSINDGVVKDLMLGKADLIMAGLTILYSRYSFRV